MPSRRNFLQWSIALGALAFWRGGAARAAEELGWLDEVQQPPAEVPADAPQLASLLQLADGTAIQTQDDWQVRRQELRQWWLEFLGDYRADRPNLPTLEVLDQERIENVIRQHVRYESEPGWSVEAYVLAPVEQGERRAGVAIFHSTVEHSIRQPAGLEGRPELALGLHLAQQGCVTICPRNFLWPDNDHIDGQGQTERFFQDHPQSKGMAKMLYDAQLAVDLLAARPDVDPERLGAFGHSLGAKEVLYLAAFDERIKATVSSEGGIGIGYSNWDDPWYLTDAVHADSFDHEHHELLGLIAPRPFLLMGGDAADGARSWPFVEGALPVYQLYTERPRIGLLNHQQGHSFPAIAAERSQEWLKTYTGR